MGQSFLRVTEANFPLPNTLDQVSPHFLYLLLRHHPVCAKPVIDISSVAIGFFFSTFLRALLHPFGSADRPPLTPLSRSRRKKKSFAVANIRCVDLQ